MRTRRLSSVAFGRAASGVLLLGLLSTAAGCIDDDAAKTPGLSLPDTGIVVTPTPDGAPPPPPPPPPPPIDASAEGGFNTSATAAGGIVTKSQNYRLITRTGGTPGSGTPGASTNFKTKPTLPGSQP